MSQNNSVEMGDKPVKDLTAWEINGHTFCLDMQDVDTLEAYEKAFKDMEVREKALPKDGPASQRVRAYCVMFRELFNRIFGDGADVKIFGEKNNACHMTEVYESFLEFVTAQTAEVAEVQARVVNRFTPNRAQRRAQAKK